MKKINLAISFLVAIIFVFFGLKYFDHKKAESSLQSQVSLPQVVEAKRQAIYKASLSHNLEKLKIEAGSDSNSPSFYEFDNEGKDKFGITGFGDTLKEEKNISIFDLIPSILKSPYTFSNNLYIWPQVVTKDTKDWNDSDIKYLKTFLSEKQIEHMLKRRAYTYSNITVSITPEGKWISYPYFKN